MVGWKFDETTCSLVVRKKTRVLGNARSNRKSLIESENSE